MKKIDNRLDLNMTDGPIVIAGPCMAESWDLLDETARLLTEITREYSCTFIFKASFDKANRTSVHSYRGPGLNQGMEWLGKIREKYKCFVTTDVHESIQVDAVAEVCDVIQIPAFLCRQTDLIVKAAQTERAITVKKGQFLSPKSAGHIREKIHTVRANRPSNFAIIERGSSFGYENLVVDMRGLKIMRDMNMPVIFDVTHSTQQPSSGMVTGGMRSCAPLLARSAVSTGYLSGLFLEVHPDPTRAQSDASTQLSPKQAKALMSQVVPMFKQANQNTDIDSLFHD